MVDLVNDDFEEAPIDLLKEYEAKAASLERLKSGQARRNRRRNAKVHLEVLEKFFAGSGHSVLDDYLNWIENSSSVSLSAYAESGRYYSHLVYSNLARIEAMSKYLRSMRSGYRFPVSDIYTCGECGFESSHREYFRLVDTTRMEEYVERDDLSIDSEGVSLCCGNCQLKYLLRVDVNSVSDISVVETGGYSE